MSPIPLGILATQGTVAPPGPTEPILTNLRIWYDANDNSFLTNASGRASNISNKAAGYTWDLTQATTGRQPEIIAAAQNGKQALKFTSARNDLLLNTGSAHPLGGATTFTVFLAFKSANSTNGYKWSIGGDGVRTCFLLFQASSKNYVETGSGTNAMTGTADVVNTANIQVVSMISGGAKSQKTFTGGTELDSVNNTNNDTFTILSTGGQDYRTSIGAGFGNSATANFDFYEILAYPNTLSTADFNTNIDYLTNKWGL
jgi:hypothetical protein